jgi:hypothetical protein
MRRKVGQIDEFFGNSIEARTGKRFWAVSIQLRKSALGQSRGQKCVVGIFCHCQLPA